MTPAFSPAWAVITVLLLPMTGCLSSIDRDVAVIDAERAQAELAEAKARAEIVKVERDEARLRAELAEAELAEAKARAELCEITRRAEMEATP